MIGCIPVLDSCTSPRITASIRPLIHAQKFVNVTPAVMPGCLFFLTFHGAQQACWLHEEGCLNHECSGMEQNEIKSYSALIFFLAN